MGDDSGEVRMCQHQIRNAASVKGYAWLMLEAFQKQPLLLKGLAGHGCSKQKAGTAPDCIGAIKRAASLLVKTHGVATLTAYTGMLKGPETDSEAKAMLQVWVLSQCDSKWLKDKQEGNSVPLTSFPIQIVFGSKGTRKSLLSVIRGVLYAFRKVGAYMCPSDFNNISNGSAAAQEQIEYCYDELAAHNWIDSYQTPHDEGRWKGGVIRTDIPKCAGDSSSLRGPEAANKVKEGCCFRVKEKFDKVSAQCELKVTPNQCCYGDMWSGRSA